MRSLPPIPAVAVEAPPPVPHTHTQQSQERGDSDGGTLLQRLEQYRGLAILTTNHDDNVDQAFLRRLRGVLRFPPPGPALRRELWKRAFPPAVPQESIDFDDLSQLELAGGHIQIVALEAAAAISESGGALTQVRKRGEFTPEEIKRLRQEFTIYDEDGDGGINVEEVMTMLQKQGF